MSLLGRAPIGALALLAVSAAASPVTIDDEHDVESHRLGPAPVVVTPWQDLTTASGGGNWRFHLVVDAQGKVATARLMSGPADHRLEAIRAVNATSFKPFQRDGHAVPVRIDYFDVGNRVEDYAGPADRGFPARPDLAQVRIALRRTSCYGTCPDYRVEVRGDGRVSYRGFDDVLAQGEYHWRITPAAVTRLVDLARRADYFKLAGYYVADASDMPSYTTRVSLGTQRKFVYDYGGGRTSGVAASASFGGPDPAMPQSVFELERAIDEVSGVASWVKGDENTMARLRDAHWDFRGKAAGKGLAMLVGECRVELALDFIRAGAPLDVRGEGWNRGGILGRAARCGDLALVRLLESKLAPIAARDAREFLVGSVSSGHADIVKLALTHDSNTRRLDADGTPLIVTAADASRPEEGSAADATFAPERVVALLVAAGADPNARDKRGNSALHAAHIDAVARALLAAGADPNARNKEGNSALHEVDGDAVARTLLAAGADPDAQNANGETPLFNRNFDGPVGALLAAGADVKARDHLGRTALFGQRLPEIAGALIRAGADVNARDNGGLTVLGSVTSEEVALMLLAAGARLPSDPAGRSWLLAKATDGKWTKLLPILGGTAGPSGGAAP
jgi:hypothetical protein